MFWTALYTLIVSIGIIWIVHTFLNYLQETYTKRKDKDMLRIHTEKYEKMLDDLTRAGNPAIPFGQVERPDLAGNPKITSQGICPATFLTENTSTTT